MASEGPETEEELWLYGGSPTCDEEDGSTPRHERSSDTLQNLSTESQDTKDVSQQVPQSCSEDEEENSDTDSDDDDVKVTIGDIRTGALSCMGSAGNLNVKTGRGCGASGKLHAKGIDFSAPGCINGLPVLEVDLDSFEDKPWRKPGADISDYFNYGFNEATWKVYCEKQRRLQMGLDTGHQTNSKITVQQGRTGNPDKGGDGGCINADLKSNLSLCGQARISSATSPNRNLVGSSDVIGGLICNITRVEGRRWDNHDSEEIPIQVVGDHGYKQHALIQHKPPPPLLPPPNIPSNIPPYPGLPPPHFFHRPPPTAQVPPNLHQPALLPPPLMPPPSVHMAPANGPHISYNSRPPLHHNYTSVETSVISYQPPVSTCHNTWVSTVNKGTNSFGRDDWTSRGPRERETERSRSQSSNSYKMVTNLGANLILRDSTPIYVPSEGDRYPHYHKERSYEHERKYPRSDERSRERSWEREDRPRGEQHQRDREESSKHKSSRHKQDSEERESHRRHKRKKSKRGKEEKSNSSPRREEGVAEGSRRDYRE
ncbi:LOW QUALITY PROTEIN: uncharacterized protein RCH25_043602 [Pelodytes ibericus]